MTQTKTEVQNGFKVNHSMHLKYGKNIKVINKGRN